MNRLFFAIFILFPLIACIHRQPASVIKECTDNEGFTNNIRMKVRTKIEYMGSKNVFIQHIFIKNAKIRIDTMGVFDDVVMSMLVENNKLYVINYQKNLIYIFSGEEQFYKAFEIYIPVFKLPYLITLSPKSIPSYKVAENNTFVLPDGDKIEALKDSDSCSVKQIEIISEKSGNLVAHYRDFSTFEGKPLYHHITIKNKQQNLNISISVIKAEKEDIPEQIMQPDNFKNFDYVRQ